LEERINCRETVVNDGRKAISVERRREEEGRGKKNKMRERERERERERLAK
jgi:hypothetical protein